MKQILGYLLVLFLFVSCTAKKVLSGYQLVWEEEFNTLDSSRWTKIPRGKSDWDRHMSYHEGCYDLRDGKLILRGINNEKLPSDTAPFLIGGVYTKDKVSFGLGKLEIRAKLGSAKGAWPAFWMMGQGKPYPEGGEIDIMEHLNYDDFVYQTLHSRYTIELNIKDNPKHYGTQRFNPNDFNVFTVEKFRDSVVLSVNGKKTITYPRIQTDKPNQFPFADMPHYLLLDMQVGGNWVGTVKKEDLPVEMEIDWVRFYQRGKGW